jgi:hypothetical protein
LPLGAQYRPQPCGIDEREISQVEHDQAAVVARLAKLLLGERRRRDIQLAAERDPDDVAVNRDTLG